MPRAPVGRRRAVPLALCAVLLSAAHAAGAAERASAPEAFEGSITVDTIPRDLSGTWEIAFGEPPGGASGLDALRFLPIRVPGTWQSQAETRPELKQYGAAWYRLRLDIGASAAMTPLAF